MLIDMTDPLWPRVSAAFNAIQGPAPDGVKPDDFAQNAVMGFIKSVVRTYEAQAILQPPQAVVEAAEAKVEADFAAQVKVADPIKV